MQPFYFLLAVLAAILVLFIGFHILQSSAFAGTKIIGSETKIRLVESPSEAKNRVIRCTEFPTRIMLKELGFTYEGKGKFHIIFYYGGYVSIGNQMIEFPARETKVFESGLFSAVKEPQDKFVTIAFMIENAADCVNFAKNGDPVTGVNMKAEHFNKRCGDFIEDSLPPLPITEADCLAALPNCYEQQDTWCVDVAQCAPPNILNQYSCPGYTVCCRSPAIRIWGEIDGEIKKDVHPRTLQNVCIVTPKFRNTGSDAWTSDKKIKARIYCDFIDGLGNIFYDSPVLSPGLQKYVELDVGAETGSDSIACTDGKVYSIELLANCVDEEFIGLPDAAGLPADCENRDDVTNLPSLLDSATVDCR